MNKPAVNAFIVGCGDIGRRVAERYIAAGRPVSAWVRSADSVNTLAKLGITGIAIDLDDASSSADAQSADAFDRRTVADGHVYYFAPPPRSGRHDPRIAHALSLLTGLQCQPSCLVYISTSAVYGDCDGRWIAEDEPLKPGTDRGHRRVDAEKQVMDYSDRTGTRVVILRVPGIYGPGRLPLDRLRKQLPVIKADESPYTNRIHAQDLADIACLAAQTTTARGAFNVSDGHPTTMSDYFLRVARRFNLADPPQLSRAEAEQQLSESMLSFLRESKRLQIDRLREELGFVPRFANLDAGLDDCAAASP